MPINIENYKKIILEAKSNGAIILRHQYLKIHQNGAKFAINKAYIDDEVLEIDIPYTMILIPEISKNVIFQLAFFDFQLGPIAFEVYPDQLTKSERIEVADMMDLYNPPMTSGFVQVSHFFCLNRYFEIPSEISRGKKEMLMITAIFPEQPNKEAIKWFSSLLEDFVTEFSNIENIFTVFYQPGIFPKFSELLNDNEETRSKVQDLFKDNEEKRKKIQDLLKNMALKTEKVKETLKEE